MDSDWWSFCAVYIYLGMKTLPYSGLKEYLEHSAMLKRNWQNV